MNPNPLELDTKKLGDVKDGALADHRNSIKLLLKDLNRQVEVLKSIRALIDKEFLKRFKARKSTGTRTDVFNIGVSTDTAYPEVFDRNALREYILRTKNLHLLQWRVSSSSVQEEIALGKTVPGVRMINKESITQSKR